MNKKQNKKSVFSTDNFLLAIFLRTKGCKLLHITKDNPRHAFFNFEETPKRRELTKVFWDGKGDAKTIRSFYESQRQLKTFLYDSSYPINIEGNYG